MVAAASFIAEAQSKRTRGPSSHVWYTMHAAVTLDSSQRRRFSVVHKLFITRKRRRVFEIVHHGSHATIRSHGCLMSHQRPCSRSESARSDASKNDIGVASANCVGYRLLCRHPLSCKRAASTPCSRANLSRTAREGASVAVRTYELY